MDDDSRRPLLAADASLKQDRRPGIANTARTAPHGGLSAAGPQLSYSPSVHYDSLSNLPGPLIQNPDDDLPEASKPPEYKVYARRWYVLGAYSLVAATQGGVWNTWGPIAASAEAAFAGWTDATIALLSNWGPIAYLLSGLLFSWMMDVKGLRMSCVITALLCAAGAAIRCITFQTPIVTWLMHAGGFLNGLGGPVAMAAPPILSAVWFPPRERTTATAIGTIFNYLGVAVSFVLGPWLVPEVSSNSTASNTSSFYLSSSDIPDATWNHSLTDTSTLLSPGNITDSDHSKIRKGIALYMYIGGGWAVFVFLLTLVYLPSKPPLPPCASAAIQRENFLQGLKHLMTRGQFWLVAMIYGVSLGTLNCWSSVLDVILKPHGIDEHEAGWIGFYATCGACVSSLIVARFADFFSRIMKWLVLCSYVLGTTAFVIFALTTIKVIPPSSVLFYVTIIGGNSAMNAAVPLLFELACELSYPTGEGTTNGVLTIMNNVSGLVFLLVLMIPGIGHSWTNWAVVGTSGICIPALFLMKEQYNRLEIDEHNPSLNAQIIFPQPQP